MPAPVSIFQGPPATAYTTLYDMVGGTNTIYTGVARSVQNTATLTVGSVSKASPAVIAVTGHGLANDNAVVISGGTGDWAGLNGARAITVIDANSFSVAVDTSAYSGTFAGTVTTNAPRTGDAVWSITKAYYDTNNSTTRTSCAAGTCAENQVWANRASLSYQ